MKLRERLDELAPNQYIKIGAVDGVSYLYAGKVKNFVPDNYRYGTEPFMHKFNRPKQEKKKGDIGKKYKKDATLGVDLADRDIKEEYKSIAEADVKIILVEGCECGNNDNDLCHPVEPLTPETVNDDGMRRLVGAIYELQAKQLVQELYDYELTLDRLKELDEDIKKLMHIKHKTLVKKDRLKASVNVYAKALQNCSPDPNGDDDAGIIAECHAIARRQITAEREAERKRLETEHREIKERKDSKDENENTATGE